MTMPFQSFFKKLYIIADKYQKLGWALCLVAVAGGLYLVYDQEPYLSYPNTPFPVQTPYVRPGDTVVLTVQRCNNSKRDGIYQIARTMENIATGRQQVLSDSIVQVSPGCAEIASRANIVPVGTLPGRYRLLGLSQIQASFRIHYVGWSSQPFEVLAP